MIELPDLGDSKYETLEKIASGGMGVVYLAREIELNRLVALKVLSVTGDGEQMIKRIRREAQILAELEHPGIVPVHDIGELPDGRVFYTMKYVQGDTLERYRGASSSHSDLLGKFQKICDAVDFAHSKNVIHRDLKPANIMVGAFGEALVMDWGIAAKKNREAKDVGQVSNESCSTSLTASGTVMGTPGYMSPEQAGGELSQIDRRSDIYSLGAILNFLLTGNSPGDSDASETSTEESGLLELPAKSRRRLGAIIHKAMRTDPAERYQNISELTGDISAFISGETISAYHESVLEKLDRWLGRNKFIVLILLAYVVVRLLLLFLLKI